MPSNQVQILAGDRGSMWQFEQFLKILQHERVTTAAFYQEDFGTDYLKPTRLLLGGFAELPEYFLEGQPTFDDQGFYTGPLVQRSAKRQLVGTRGDRFATTGSEQWPSNMCRWIATCILQQFSSWHLATTAALADEGVQTKDSDRQNYEVLKPDGK